MADAIETPVVEQETAPAPEVTAQPAKAEPDATSTSEKRKSLKAPADKRVQELLRIRRKLLNENEFLRSYIKASDAELEQLRPIAAQREAEQKEIPERAARAVAEGRRLYGAAEFDHVTAQVALSPEAFKALLASPYGPQLMYALGIGTLMLNQAVETTRQQQITKQKFDHYREMHKQHFAGTGAEAIG